MTRYTLHYTAPGGVEATTGDVYNAALLPRLEAMCRELARVGWIVRIEESEVTE